MICRDIISVPQSPRAHHESSEKVENGKGIRTHTPVSGQMTLLKASLRHRGSSMYKKFK